MSYVALSDLSGSIPAEFLTQALDDDGDGVIDDGGFDSIAADVGTDIDAYLGLRYALPLAPPYPPVVLSAAKVLACERIYKRRSIEDSKNPWSAQAGQIRTMLKSISLGQAPLSPDLNRKDPSVSIIAEPARTAGCFAGNSA
jgi:phage gp36-like protein